MSASAWSHLPNAALINRIISSLAQNPQDWTKAWDEVRKLSRLKMRDSTRETARVAASNLGRASTWIGTWQVVWNTHGNMAVAWTSGSAGAWDACAALIAWDRASSYMSLTSSEVKTLACLGDVIAILILPAVFALEIEKFKENQLAL